MPATLKPRQKHPNKPPKRDLISVLFGWAYIIVAISLIVLLLSHSQPQGRLICEKNTLAPPLTGFGTCREEKQ